VAPLNNYNSPQILSNITGYVWFSYVIPWAGCKAELQAGGQVTQSMSSFRNNHHSGLFTLRSSRRKPSNYGKRSKKPVLVSVVFTNTSSGPSLFRGVRKRALGQVNVATVSCTELGSSTLYFCVAIGIVCPSWSALEMS